MSKFKVRRQLSGATQVEQQQFSSYSSSQFSLSQAFQEFLFSQFSIRQVSKEKDKKNEKDEKKNLLQLL